VSHISGRACRRGGNPHQREYKPGEFTDIPLTLVAKKAR
jgi:hypothetical protein